MARFLLSSSLFCVPIALLFLFPLTVFVVGRELVPINDAVSRQQQSEKALYKLAYNDNTKAFKIATTIARDPEILVLGTSRAMQFRSEFFSEPSTFYNAAGIRNAADLLYFLRKLPQTSNVRVIIVGAEPVFLTTLSPRSSVNEAQTRLDLVYAFLKGAWRDAYADYRRGKYSLAQLRSARAENASLGVAALITESGFRPDGSYEPGSFIDGNERMAEIDGQVPAQVAKITGAWNEYGDIAISEEYAKDMEQFLSEARDRNITVVGYVPPIAYHEYQALMDVDNAYTRTMRNSIQRQRGLFEKNGHAFHETYDLTSFGSSDQELIDDGHESEKTFARLLRYLADREPVLAAYVRPDLSTMLIESESDVRVFPR